MPRQSPLKDFRGSRLRSTAAVFTTLSALAATSLVTGPSIAEPFSAVPCALQRTDVHHSEGLDTWNAAYPRPTRALKNSFSQIRRQLV